MAERADGADVAERTDGSGGYTRPDRRRARQDAASGQGPQERAARRARRLAGVPTIRYPEDLPVAARRDELLEAIAAHQVVIVAGATGSGKSTQLPKLCLELGRGIDGFIGHTQPRRVAARTIAERVAHELGTEVGKGVGYAVRFTDKVSDGTYIKVMTDGILLAEIQHDRLLRRYDTLIIDEAHERTLNIDFLLGYVRQILPQRPDLKVIITSATIDTDRFSKHFGDAPIVTVEGRTFPVEVRYRPFGQPIEVAGGAPAPTGDEPDDEPDQGERHEGDDVIDDDRDQVEAIVDAVAELRAEGPGDILVFLSGEREIAEAARAIADRAFPEVEVLPLYARLSAAEQHRVFEPHAGRRVVLATNVAETSITVPGVRYVVDTGTARISRYSHRLKVQRLPIEKVSRASADQRAGRCGRVGPGICIRLYDQEDFDQRPAFTEPEIQRTNLASVILSMTNLGLGDVEAFPFLDPPDHRAVNDGVALLEELGALVADQPAHQRRLTPVGRKLVRLPIDPRMGRMVVEAERHDCVAEVIVIAAALSIQDVRERPREHQARADQLHARFKVPGSDLLGHLVLWQHLEARRTALSGNAFRRELKAEHLNFLRVREWRDLVNQLVRAGAKARVSGAALRGRTGSGSKAAAQGSRRAVEALDGAGLDAVTGGEGDDELAEVVEAVQLRAEAVHRSILAGLLSHLGQRDRETREFRGARSAKFQIAPGSVLARRPPAWVMAAELVETNRLWARGVAAIKPEWVEELAGPLVKRSYGDPRWDERSGRAVTTERVTLYGLPIVTGRTVGYDKVDRAEARSLFIEHALVRREWDTHHRFVDHNEAVLEDAEHLGDRLRRDELFDRDETLRRFYESRVGEQVTSGRHFDRWWKQCQRTEPERLQLRFEDLVGDGFRYEPAQYPDWWRQGDLLLDLAYRYDLDDPLDGVSVLVPMAVLNRVEPWDFDWHIPAHRPALVESLLATLPKAVRRDLVPLAPVAEAVATRLRFEPVPLVEAVAKLVGEVSDVRIAPSDFEPSRLPPFLRLNFVATEGDEVVAYGKDLAAVQDLVKGRVRAAVAQAVGEVERTGLTRWDFEDLPEVVRTMVGDHPVEGYPALVDATDSVAIKVFSKRAVAERIHHLGLRRLLLLTVPVGIKGIEREVSNKVRLALSTLEGMSLGGLLRDVITATADDVIARRGGAVRTREGFEAMVAAARGELRGKVVRTLAAAGRVLVAASEVAIRLDRMDAPALAWSADEARAHLGRLVVPGFVTAAGVERMADLERYVTGIGRRLDALGESPQRDRNRWTEVAAVERYHHELLDALAASQVTDRVRAVRWQIEELRLSVFAQAVGVRGQVSAKRIRAEIDDLFAGNLHDR